MTITIVDIRDKVTDAQSVDRSTPLGNPFKATTPGSTKQEYRRWLWESMQDEDGEVFAALHFLVERLIYTGELALACWCHGAATCHAHTVADAVRYLEPRFTQSDGVGAVSEVKAMRSAAGWYAGRSYFDTDIKCDLPYSRESDGYYATEAEAQAYADLLNNVLA